MDVVSILLVALVGWLVLRATNPAAAASVSSVVTSALSSVSTAAASVAPLEVGDVYSSVGPGSDPATWYQGIKPGTVTIGGSPAPDGWDPGNVKTAQTAASLAGTGVSATLGIGAAFGATSSGGALAAGTLAGTAIPLFGIGVLAVGAVLSVLSAHHQAALAAEGKALNDANPRMYNALVMVLQAVLYGEITDLATAEAALEQIVSDWYAEVKSIQKGTWPYIGSQFPRPDWNDAWGPGRSGPFGSSDPNPDSHHPDNCNAACVVGHFFVERGKFVVLAAVRDVLAGNHGVMVLPLIPAKDTQTGFPEVRVSY